MVPGPRLVPLEYLDLAVLAAVLAAASWLALRGRSRRATFWVVLFTAQSSTLI
jgi:hypothetical protein